MLCRRLRLPYSTGLVAAGIGLAALGGPFAFSVPPTALYTLLLPPLIFEAALQLDWSPVRRDLPVTLTLAFPGVVWTGAIVAAGMHVAIGWTWTSAALFGALIAATDPVSVLAAFKELKVTPRLSLLVESESLLNDGTAAVGFAIMVAIAEGHSLDAVGVIGLLLWMVLGGIGVGVIVAIGSLLLARRTNDHLIEITLTTIAAYGSFLLAEYLGASGILASLAAGLVVGNRGNTISSIGREHAVSFWEYAAFLANTFVFILIGSYEAAQGTALITRDALVAVGLVLLARVLTIYPLCRLFRRTVWKIEHRHQHVLAWGGLRGALALALALAVPDDVPEKRLIIVGTFAVVAFSVFAQGLTMPWLIDRLGLSTEDR
jgi:CPA1 family monovalent cation:H+ antiporter